MKRLRRPLVRLLVALVGCGSLAAASASHADDRARMEDPFEITADRIDYDGTRDLYVATGQVRVVQTGRTLRANWVAFSTLTRVGVAEGDVELVDARDVLTSSFMVFDVGTLRGMFYEGGFDAGSEGFQIRAKEMIRTGENTFSMRDGVFTTCRCEEGERLPWQIRTEEADVEVGGYGTVRNATFEVLGVPMLWVPWAFFPVKSDRESGVLLPEFEVGGRSGYGWGLPIFWAAHPQVNVLFTPRYLSERGFKGDGKIEYVFGERSEGSLFVSGLLDNRDREIELLERRSRWGVKWEHDQDLPASFRWQTNLNLVSDNFYPEDFEEFTGYRAFRFLESTSHVTREFGRSGAVGFSAGGRFADDVQGVGIGDRLRDSDDFILQRFGEAAVDVQRGALPDLFGVDFRMDAEAIHFAPLDRDDSVFDGFGAAPIGGDGRFFDLGAAGTIEDPSAFLPDASNGRGNGLFEPGEAIAERGLRVVLHPRVGRTFRIADWATFEPEVGWRQSLYSTDRQRFGERGLVTARAELRSRLARDFVRENGQRWRHVLEPRLGWAFVSARQQDRNPLFVPQGTVTQSRLRTLSLENVTRNPSDRVDTANQVVLGLGQRFYRSAGPGGQTGLVGELLTAVDWDFAEGGLGAILLDGRVRQLGPIGLRAVAAFDPEAVALEETGLDLTFFRAFENAIIRRVDWVIGHRYRRRLPALLEADRGIVRIGELDSVNQIFTSGRVEVGSRVRLRVTSILDVADEPRALRNEGAIEYVSKCRCWSVGANISIDRREDIGGGILFRFVGLGDRDGNLFDSGFGTGLNF